MSVPEPEHESATLVGLLDGLIDRGVHVSGDVVIGLADVELIRVALRLLVASEDTVQRTGAPPRGAHATGNRPATVACPQDTDRRARAEPVGHEPDRAPRAALGARERLPSGSRAATTSIADADRDQLVRGVSQLVLTLVEVIRELLERQAVRRVEAGSLTGDQVERLGVALEALADRMAELKDVFGFEDDELNLDLGPLGRLR